MQWYNAEVIDIIQETYNIRRFYLRFNEVELYNFEAGQHLLIEFPIPSKKNYRQYSIANAPNNTNIVELLIILDPDGLATNYLFKEIKIGSFLKTSEPRGNFLLNTDFLPELCFISTGTGLAPLRSMYLDILNRNLNFEKMHIIFGTRYMRDLIYLDEFDELVINPKIAFYPILSKETSPDWMGRTGYVHSIYKNLFEKPQNIEYYICGWREMVSQTRNNLLEMGIDRKLIHFERYD